MSEWGGRIEIRMRDLGMSQTALAAACGIKPPSVNDWISGKTKMIDGLNLVRAAKALQTTPEWIMTGRGEQSQPVGMNIPMLSEALVSLDKAIRHIGLKWDAAYVAPALMLAYEERLRHPNALDRTSYALYDGLVEHQLRGEARIEEERRAEKDGSRGTGKAQATGAKAGSG